MKIEGGHEYIFCLARKRWLRISPEEWVRQNFLLYLAEVLHYPVSLVAVEKKIIMGDVINRYDIVVFNRSGDPVMLVECKEMNVRLGPHTLDQVLRYNSSLQAGCLVITNGSHCYGFQKQDGVFVELKELPLFQ